MVKMIAEVSNHKIHVSKGWNWVVKLASIIPGKPKGLANKAFGNMSYEQNMSRYGFQYQVVSLFDSIRKTEG